MRNIRWATNSACLFNRESSNYNKHFIKQQILKNALLLVTNLTDNLKQTLTSRLFLEPEDFSRITTG